MEVQQGRSKRRINQKQRHRGCGCDVDGVKRIRAKASVN